MPLIVPNTAVNVRHGLELTFEDLHKAVIKVEQKPGDDIFFVALRRDVADFFHFAVELEGIADKATRAGVYQRRYHQGLRSEQLITLLVNPHSGTGNE